MNKLILVILLITYSICDDCTSLTTESTCTAKSGCKWTATPTCTGDDSCTSKKTSESECTETQYTSQLACTFTPAATPTCTGDETCTEATSSPSACTSIKFGGTACEYNSETKACSGGTGTECTSVTSLEDDTECTSTKYGQNTCVYTAGTCTGNDACTRVTDLSSATACEGTSYDGPEVNCTYVAGTCSADTGTGGNDNSCGIIKFSILFSFLCLLF